MKKRVRREQAEPKPAPRKRRMCTARPEPVIWATSEEYNPFVRGVELLSVRLGSCSVYSPHPCLDGDPKGEMIEGTPRYVNTPGGFVTYFGVDLECRNGDDDGDPTAIKVEFVLEYSSTAGPMDDRLFAVFQEHTLALNAWPWVREILLSLLARAEWPAFVIPLRMVRRSERGGAVT